MFVWLIHLESLRGGHGFIIHGVSVWAEHINNYDDHVATFVLVKLFYDSNMH